MYCTVVKVVCYCFLTSDAKMRKKILVFETVTNPAVVELHF